MLNQVSQATWPPCAHAYAVRVPGRTSEGLATKMPAAANLWMDQVPLAHDRKSSTSRIATGHRVLQCQGMQRQDREAQTANDRMFDRPVAAQLHAHVRTTTELIEHPQCLSRMPEPGPRRINGSSMICIEAIFFADRWYWCGSHHHQRVGAKRESLNVRLIEGAYPLCVQIVPLALMRLNDAVTVETLRQPRCPDTAGKTRRENLRCEIWRS